MPKHFSNYFQYLEKQDRRTRLTFGIVTFGLLLFLVVGIMLPFNGLLSKYFNKEHSHADEMYPGENSFQFSMDWVSQTTPQDWAVNQFIQQGLFNTVGLWPSLPQTTIDWLEGNKFGVKYENPASDMVAQWYHDHWNPGFQGNLSFIQAETAKMQALTAVNGRRAWYDVMQEWDGAGGWINRPEYPLWWGTNPRPVRTRQESFDAFKQYYFSLNPLGTYLQQTPAQRGFNMLANTSLPGHVHYAYDWGVDMSLLEVNNDDIPGIESGVPFIRGAGKQYDKPYGYQESTTRVECGVSFATIYSGNQLLCGWSPSYFKRNLFLGFMSGARMIHFEQVGLFTQDGGPSTALNPLGQAVKQFADFALRNHTSDTIGKSEVPIALVMNYVHGWNPRYRIYQRGAGHDFLWQDQWTLPWGAGDYMQDNLFSLFLPDYWLSGTTPNATWSTPTEFAQKIQAGMDTRPYEPMAKSTWGDVFDVLLSNAPLSALQKYKIIILTGDVTVSPALQTALQQWVQAGGTLIANIRQPGLDNAFLGVTPSATVKQGSDSKWLADNSSFTEDLYDYTLVTPTTATVIANNSAGDPIITRNAVGSGEVYLVTPHYMQSKDYTALSSKILSIGQKLIDTKLQPLTSVKVQGPKTIYYTVNTASDKTVITILNNDLAGSTWNGTVSFNLPSGSYTTKDWTSDTDIPNAVQSGKVVVNVTVPPYDVKVFALQYSPQPSVTPAPLPSGAKVLWPSNPTPQLPETSVGNAIEVGTKFTADVSGVVNGVRFYKGVDNTGTHTGTLWDANGNQLATATFSNETASGWQQVLFSSPVSIQANTTYVVSYHTDTGHYSGDANFFNTGVDNAPLHAPASSAVAGGNGVYLYGAHAFPNQTNAANNYWVDVIFTSSGGSGGTVPSPTNTPMPIPTNTPTPTATPTPRPTATPTPRPTATPTPTPAAINLIQNSGFENGNSYWQTYNSTWVAGNAHSGANAVRVSPTGGNQTQTVSIVQGKTYLYSGWAKVSAAGTQGIIGIHLLDKNGNILRDFSAGPYVTSTTYTKFSLPITMDSSVYKVRVYIYHLSGSGVIYADDISLVAQ